LLLIFGQEVFTREILAAGLKAELDRMQQDMNDLQVNVGVW